MTILIAVTHLQNTVKLHSNKFMDNYSLPNKVCPVITQQLLSSQKFAPYKRVGIRNKNKC